MNAALKYFMILVEWMYFCLKHGIRKLLAAVPLANNWAASSGVTDGESCSADSEKWKTHEALRTYRLRDGTEVTVQTSTHAFHVSIKHSVHVLTG